MGTAEVLLRRRATAPHVALACVLALVVLILAAQPSPSGETQRDAKVPLAFVANAGQTDSSVQFVARGANHAFYFTPSKAVLDFQRGDRGVALELRFRGANPNPQVVAERRTSARVNYLTGSRPSTNLATYSQLRYRELWPGIDMVFRGEGGGLEYEFLVRPGADPGRIRLAYDGADSLRLSEHGSLLIGTPLGTLRDAPPKSTQGGARVDSRYATSGSSYGFALGAYDRSRPLLIDPLLAYSTFLGGSDDDYPGDVAVDEQGYAYVAGTTMSLDFPTTPGAYDTTCGCFSVANDGFVTKLTPDGASVVYSTYLGGGANDGIAGIAVDAVGNAYVTGSTHSDNFPTTPGAFRTSCCFAPTNTSFVAKLNPAGSGLVYSTFLGDEDFYGPGPENVDIDAAGNAYVTGATQGGMPTTPGAYDRNLTGFLDGYVAKLNASGSALVYSTLLGGDEGEDMIEGAFAIAVDAAGAAYVTGQTMASNFPTTPGAAQGASGGGLDGFVSKILPDGSGLAYSSYLGGSDYDYAEGVDVDAGGHAYVTGSTASPDFATTPGAYDRILGSGPAGDSDAFVTKLNGAGTALDYSTYLGGAAFEGDDFGADIAVDGAGRAHVTGSTTSTDFPVTSDAPDTSFGARGPAFVSKLDAAGANLVYSTFLSGGEDRSAGKALALDPQGGAHVVGSTSDYATFPTTAGSFDPTFNGGEELFVAKLLPESNTYVRPKGATPAYFSLATAYEPCSSPDRTHGPPLAFASCSGPQMTSDFLTVGTGDSNGKPARNDGYLRLDVQAGNPATPADEADVKVGFFLDDIFNKDLTDYTGELRASFTVRATDRNNAPSPTAGTTQDFSVAFSAPCTPNPDVLEGSACALSTAVDALIPGAIAEGKRSVWRVTDVRVFDGGADGDGDTTGDNTLFATQGLFIP